MEHDLPRIQKVLAAAGVASRRACEDMIAAGRVTVNGKRVTEQGLKVDPAADDIRVDGEPVLLDKPVAPIYILLHKPVGYVCTAADAHAGRTIMELVDQVSERIYPVGRLDADSSGLLLMTNDGEFANRLTHPRFHVPKIYRVRARGFVTRESAIMLSEGIDLPDGKTAPANVKYVDYDRATQCTILDITLYEGRNRQVRRMLDAVGHPVRELIRIAYGSIQLKDLNAGTWRKLRPDEVADLLSLAQPTPTPKREARRPRNEAMYRPDAKPAASTPAAAEPAGPPPTSSAARPPQPLPPNSPAKPPGPPPSDYQTRPPKPAPASYAGRPGRPMPPNSGARPAGSPSANYAARPPRPAPPVNRARPAGPPPAYYAGRPPRPSAPNNGPRPGGPLSSNYATGPGRPAPPNNAPRPSGPPPANDAARPPRRAPRNSGARPAGPPPPSYAARPPRPAPSASRSRPQNRVNRPNPRGKKR